MPDPAPLHHATAIEDLKTLLGPRGWLEGPDTDGRSTDFRGMWTQRPLLVARPDSVEDVAAVVKICVAANLSIVGQGGNTGLSGGSIPTDQHSIVVSTERLNTIIDVDPHCFTLTAEAGVTIEALQAAAVAVDRSFASDWGARGTATIGGGVSTDAGGNNVLRFGTVRSQVLGLEVVLPDGRIWNGLRSLRKDATGYGLKHLFIGAEGTLGIVTKVVVKLEPRPLHQQSLFASVSSLDALPELYALGMEMAEGRLTAFELMPDMGIRRVAEVFDALHHPLPDAPPRSWFVLGRMSGRTPVTEYLTDFLSQATERGLITDAVVADTPTQEVNLWTIRDELPPEPLLGSKGAKFDAAVPVSNVAEYLQEVDRRTKLMDPTTAIYAFGHVGDGNLHLYVLPGEEPGLIMDPGAKAEYLAVVDEITWSFGGTISAEHGIGQELRHRVVDQKGDVEVELMRLVKKTLDPGNLFNPGKVFDDA